MAQNGAIGIDNKLPWNIPSELEWFRKKTKGQLIVVGRNTFNSIKHKDKDALYVVLTRDKSIKGKDGNVIYINEISELDNIQTDRQVWIAGGAQIYKQTIDKCDELYLSIIKKEYEGDRYFPDFKDYFIMQDIIEENDLFVIRHYLSEK